MANDTSKESSALPEDEREKFLAALEAKKHRAGHGGPDRDSGAHVKGHSSRSGGKREFRRKSGG